MERKNHRVSAHLLDTIRFDWMMVFTGPTTISAVFLYPLSVYSSCLGIEIPATNQPQPRALPSAGLRVARYPPTMCYATAE